MPTDHNNANGLIDGGIPEDKACPWINNCAMRVQTCPTERTAHPTPYSCGLARFHSLMIEADNGK